MRDMSSSLVRKISRTDVEVATVTSQDEPFELPELEFEFVDVDNIQDLPQDTTNDEPQDEFEFPLFSAPLLDDGNRGRTSVMQKVSLREPSIERIEQSRPTSYYFTKTDPVAKKQFEDVLVSGDDVLLWSRESVIDTHPWRVIDLKTYNDKVEAEKVRNKQKRQRLGKKKRKEIIKCRERKLQRLKLEKSQQRELKKKLMKKIHHKRGGKKNKKQKKATTTEKPRPKYKTE